MSNGPALDAHERAEHARHAAHARDPFIANACVTVAVLARDRPPIITRRRSFRPGAMGLGAVGAGLFAAACLVI